MLNSNTKNYEVNIQGAQKYSKVNIWCQLAASTNYIFFGFELWIDFRDIFTLRKTIKITEKITF